MILVRAPPEPLSRSPHGSPREPHAPYLAASQINPTLLFKELVQALLLMQMHRHLGILYVVHVFVINVVHYILTCPTSYLFSSSFRSSRGISVYFICGNMLPSYTFNQYLELIMR